MGKWVSFEKWLGFPVRFKVFCKKCTFKGLRRPQQTYLIVLHAKLMLRIYGTGVAEWKFHALLYLAM